MIQTCNLCGKEVETGGFGGLPMKQHYKHKHPSRYFGAGRDDEQVTLETFSELSDI